MDVSISAKKLEMDSSITAQMSWMDKSVYQTEHRVQMDTTITGLEPVGGV
jgi:hypothetical protein